MPTAQAKANEIEIGDTVQFTGGYHYTGANSLVHTGGKRTAGQAKVTNIAKGQNTLITWSGQVFMGG